MTKSKFKLFCFFKLISEPTICSILKIKIIFNICSFINLIYFWRLIYCRDHYILHSTIFFMLQIIIFKFKILMFYSSKLLMIIRWYWRLEILFQVVTNYTSSFKRINNSFPLWLTLFINNVMLIFINPKVLTIFIKTSILLNNIIYFS